MFAGFLKNLRTIDDWLSWLEYLSMFRYSLNVSIEIVIARIVEVFIGTYA